jgi:hypothetical protein
VQVSFLMNNLTVDNMDSKSKDLGSVIIPKFIEWFANYLVVKRAAQVRLRCQLDDASYNQCIPSSGAEVVVYVQDGCCVSQHVSRLLHFCVSVMLGPACYADLLLLMMTAGAQPPQDVCSAAGCAGTQGPLQERAQHHVLLLQVRQQQLQNAAAKLRS